MKNSKLFVYLVSSVALIFVALFIIYIFLNGNTLRDAEKDLVSKPQNEIANKNKDLELAISKYNIEDKFIEKTSGGHIVCRTDLNCLFRYYMECKESDAVFFDYDANHGYAFLVLDNRNGKCSIQVLSQNKDIDSYNCSIPLIDLSKDNFDKILKQKTREKLDLCTKIGK